VSESLGKETIDVETKNRTKGHKSNSTSESNSILGRELMTPSELLTMPITNCILMVRAFNPFYCEKYPIEKHPNFRLLEDFDKKNMFDKTCIKVKTQSDFEKENLEKRSENNSENNNISEKTNSEYIQKIIDFTASQNVKSSVIKPVSEDFESYEEAEYYSENNLIFDTEIYADTKVFSVPSDIEYVDLGEPKSDFRSEIYGKLKGGDDNVENEKCDNKNAEKPQYIEDFSSEKIQENYEEEDNFYDFSDDMDTSENIAETFRKTSDITQNEELADIFGLSIDRYLMSGF
jgi:type IV secretion system protein VirD4